MLKKILCASLLLVSYTASSFAYVYGGSNLYGMYPAFSYYVAYNPTYDDLMEMRRKVQEYIENGNSDIQRIQEAQEDALQQYNRAFQNYNFNQSLR